LISDSASAKALLLCLDCSSWHFWPGWPAGSYCDIFFLPF